MWFDGGVLPSVCVRENLRLFIKQHSVTLEHFGGFGEQQNRIFEIRTELENLKFTAVVIIFHSFPTEKVQ
jgi:hypothetical protein